MRNKRIDWYISQAGDGSQFEDWFACAPTTLLMALADFGLAIANEPTRQMLIELTETLPGTGFSGGIERMSIYTRLLGLHTVVHYSNDRHKSELELSDSTGAIAYGGMQLPTGGYTGHFIYLSGSNANNDFILGDPADPDTDCLTRQALRNFLNRSPNPGGFLIVRESKEGEREGQQITDL
jgi:hypothetical protein